MSATRLFGFLSLLLGVGILVALYASNGMDEASILQHYWYAVAIAAVLIIGGAALSAKWKE